MTLLLEAEGRASPHLSPLPPFHLPRVLYYSGRGLEPWFSVPLCLCG